MEQHKAGVNSKKEEWFPQGKVTEVKKYGEGNLFLVLLFNAERETMQTSG